MHGDGRDRVARRALESAHGCFERALYKIRLEVTGAEKKD